MKIGLGHCTGAMGDLVLVTPPRPPKEYYPPPNDNWNEKYLRSDHHTDRPVLNRHRRMASEPPSLRPRVCNFTGREGPRMFDSNIMTIRTSSTRRRAFDDDLDIPTFSRRAHHIGSHALDDADAIRHASRRQDAHLLNDITSRLCRLEFDTVKPSLDIAMQTGFRRHIYSNKRPPLTKELRQAMRKDRLRYPWDYTKDNLYRPPRRSKKTPREQLKERMDGDPYPIHDPFALYRPRARTEHASLEDVTSIAEQYAKMTPRQVLARAKAKAITAPDQRDPSEDIDNMLSELSRPLPKSTTQEIYVPYTGDLYDFNLVYDDGEKLDAKTHGKIEASRADIQAFERMLNERNAERMNRPLVHVAAFQRLQDLHKEGILDGEDSAPYSSPVGGRRRIMVQRTARASSMPPPSRRTYSEDLDFPEYHHHSTTSRSTHPHVFVRAGSEPRFMPSMGHSFSSSYSRRPIHRAKVFVRAGSEPRFMPSMSDTSHYDSSSFWSRPYSSSFWSRPIHRAKYDLGLDDYYGLEDEIPITRRHYPTRTVVTASNHHHYGGGLVSSRPPLPTRVHPRAQKYMMDSAYDHDYYVPTRPVAPSSYTNLRSRAAECRSKMDHQKVLLDRYLPVTLGPENAVQYEVEAKYGELAARRRLSDLLSLTHGSDAEKSYVKPKMIRRTTVTEYKTDPYFPASCRAEPRFHIPEFYHRTYYGNPNRPYLHPHLPSWGSVVLARLQNKPRIVLVDSKHDLPLRDRYRPYYYSPTAYYSHYLDFGY